MMIGRERCIVPDYHTFVDSCNFSNKDNSDTSEIEVFRRQNYTILATLLRKRSYFVKKSFASVKGMECSYGKMFSPVAEISVGKPRSRQPSQPTFLYEHSEIFTKD